MRSIRAMKIKLWYEKYLKNILKKWKLLNHWNAPIPLGPTRRIG